MSHCHELALLHSRHTAIAQCHAFIDLCDAMIHIGYRTLQLKLDIMVILVNWLLSWHRRNSDRYSSLSSRRE